MDFLKKSLNQKIFWGNFFSKIATILSFNKRKYSTAEFYIENLSLSPEAVAIKIKQIMMTNSKENISINLNTNPDHYLLKEITNQVQEVVEYTGGSPLSTHFFAHYDDTKNLTSKLTKNYTQQLVGTARSNDGFIIGGVRHQIKQEKNGIRFKALVEFPAILPNYMIKKHQWHLTCEFEH